jgi:hypothetical protein
MEGGGGDLLGEGHERLRLQRVTPLPPALNLLRSPTEAHLLLFQSLQLRRVLVLKLSGRHAGRISIGEAATCESGD